MGTASHVGSQAGVGTLVIPDPGNLVWGYGLVTLHAPLSPAHHAGPSSLAHAGTSATLVQRGPVPPCPPVMRAWVGHTNCSGWTPCDSQNPQLRAGWGSALKGHGGARSKQDHTAGGRDHSACAEPSAALALSPSTCANPPGDKLSQHHKSRDSAPHAHKPGRLRHPRCSENPSGGGDGGRQGSRMVLSAWKSARMDEFKGRYALPLHPCARCPWAEEALPVPGAVGSPCSPPGCVPSCRLSSAAAPGRSVGAAGRSGNEAAEGPADLLFISTPLARPRSGSGRVNHLGLPQPCAFHPGWDNGVPARSPPLAQPGLRSHSPAELCGLCPRM